MSEWTQERVLDIALSNKEMTKQTALRLHRAGLLSSEDEQALYPALRSIMRAEPIDAKDVIRIRNRLPKYWKEIGRMINPEVAAELAAQEERDSFAGSW